MIYNVMMDKQPHRKSRRIWVITGLISVLIVGAGFHGQGRTELRWNMHPEAKTKGYRRTYVENLYFLGVRARERRWMSDWQDRVLPWDDENAQLSRLAGRDYWWWGPMCLGRRPKIINF